MADYFGRFLFDFFPIFLEVFRISSEKYDSSRFRAQHRFRGASKLYDLWSYALPSVIQGWGVRMRVRMRERRRLQWRLVGSDGKIYNRERSIKLAMRDLFPFCFLSQYFSDFAENGTKCVKTSTRFLELGGWRGGRHSWQRICLVPGEIWFNPSDRIKGKWYV